MTQEEYGDIMGRLAALEILTAQSLAFSLFRVSEENRDDAMLDLLNEIKKRVPLMDPAIQASCLDCAQRVGTSALVTARAFTEANKRDRR